MDCDQPSLMIPEATAAKAPARRAGWIAFFTLLLAFTALKLAIVRTGADEDVDAYAHALAGRRMLLDPSDATVHWVWLPLLHALYAGATALGGGLSTLRIANAFLSSLTPLLLAWHLRDHLRATSPERASGPLPWLAGALLLVDPLCLWMGVTGQTEPFFQFFIVVASLASERRAFTAAGSLYAAAALTRYETWPLLPVLFLLALHEQRETERPASLLAYLEPSRRHLVWLLPSLAVAAWCLFHYRATGQPLQFLRYNRDFARGFLAGVGYPWGREPSYFLMTIFYPLIVPALYMLGPGHLFTLAGIARARSLPRWLLVTGAALLAIVTFGFLCGAHLGLSRHAAVLSPLYCALAALGTLRAAEKLTPRFPRVSPERLREIAAFAVLALVLVTRTVPRTFSLWRATAAAFTEQATAAKALRAIARPREPIFCEDGKIEVLSELSPDRFIRWQLPDVAPEHVTDLARKNGSALVVASPSRMAHLPGGRIEWNGAGLAIVRFDAPP